MYELGTDVGDASIFGGQRANCCRLKNTSPTKDSHSNSWNWLILSYLKKVFEGVIKDLNIGKLSWFI